MSQLLLGSSHFTFLPFIILLFFLQWKTKGSQEEAALAGNSVCVAGCIGGGGGGGWGVAVKSSVRIETCFRGLNHLLQIQPIDIFPDCGPSSILDPIVQTRSCPHVTLGLGVKQVGTVQPWLIGRTTWPKQAPYFCVSASSPP